MNKSDEQIIEEALVSEATRSGMKDPLMALRADRTLIRVTDGIVSGARDAVENLLQEKPHLQMSIKERNAKFIGEVAKPKGNAYVPPANLKELRGAQAKKEVEAFIDQFR